MSLFDIGILVLMFVSAMLGYRSGLIQAFFSLAGLFAGISIAAHSYQTASNEVMPYVHDQTFADGLGFCLILALVMVIAGVIGWALKRMIEGVGLEWLDKILGLFFGLVRGVLLVSLCIVLMSIFLPGTLWATDAQLSKYFRGGVDLTVKMWPDDLQEKVTGGMHELKKESKEILHKEAKQLANPK
jgi:membrane protein required for colicin V production